MKILLNEKFQIKYEKNQRNNLSYIQASSQLATVEDNIGGLKKQVVTSNKQILKNGLIVNQNMGKRKNETQLKVTFKLDKKISKEEKQERKFNRVLSFSTSNIINSHKLRNEKISKNIRNALKKLSCSGKSDNKKRLLSALNIASEKQIICSAMNIPSIQNMLSRRELLSYDYLSQSGVSFIESMSYLLIESEPDLMLSYMCLVQKALHNLGMPLSPQQNEKLLKGVWNIVLKFWSDDFEGFQYPNLNAQIEWGLLELLNFDLKIGKKQRILMESKIKSTLYIQK